MVRERLEGEFEVEAVEGLVLEGIGDGAVVLEKVVVDVCAGWGREVGDGFGPWRIGFSSDWVDSCRRSWRDGLGYAP